MKDCSEISQLASLYVDGELNESERLKLMEHIKTCQACCKEIKDIKYVVGLCRDIGEVELPENFRQELHLKLINASVKKAAGVKAVLLHSKYFKLFSSIAACIMLVVTLKGLFDSGFFSSGSLKTAQMENADNAPLAFSQETDQDKAIEGEKGINEAKGETADVFSSKQQGESKDELMQGRSNSYERRVNEPSEDDALKSLVINTVNMTLCLNDSTDEKTVKEEIISLITEYNGMLAETGHEGVVLKAMDSAEAEKEETVIHVKVPNIQYEKFINALATHFGTENIKIEQPITQDMTSYMESLKMKLEDMEQIIKEIESGENITDPDETERLKREKDVTMNEIERISLNSDFTFMNIFLEQK